MYLKYLGKYLIYIAYFITYKAFKSILFVYLSLISHNAYLLEREMPLNKAWLKQNIFILAENCRD